MAYRPSVDCPDESRWDHRQPESKFCFQRFSADLPSARRRRSNQPTTRHYSRGAGNFTRGRPRRKTVDQHCCVPGPAGGRKWKFHSVWRFPERRGSGVAFLASRFGTHQGNETHRTGGSWSSGFRHSISSITCSSAIRVRCSSTTRPDKRRRIFPIPATLE